MELLVKVNALLEYMVEVFGPGLFLVGAAFMFLHCFFGHQLLRVWSTMIGILLGAFIGFHFCSTLELSVAMNIVICAIAAAALGWVFYQVYMVGIFCIFGAIGFGIVYLLSPEASKLVYALAVIGLGTVGVLAVRPVTIVLSAAVGSVLGSWLFLAARGNYEIKSLLTMAAITAGLGIICQFFLTAPIKDKNEDTEESPQEEKTKSRKGLSSLFVREIPSQPQSEKIEPVESIQPEYIPVDNSFPSSDELDRMIEEQLQDTSFESLTISLDGPNDFLLSDEESEHNFAEAEAESFELPSDEVIDEMIAEAIPDADEYLPSRDTLAGPADEEKGMTLEQAVSMLVELESEEAPQIESSDEEALEEVFAEQSIADANDGSLDEVLPSEEAVPEEESVLAEEAVPEEEFVSAEEETAERAADEEIMENAATEEQQSFAFPEIVEDAVAAEEIAAFAVEAAEEIEDISVEAVEEIANLSNDVSEESQDIVGDAAELAEDVVENAEETLPELSEEAENPVLPGTEEPAPQEEISCDNTDAQPEAAADMPEAAEPAFDDEDDTEDDTEDDSEDEDAEAASRELREKGQRITSFLADLQEKLLNEDAAPGKDD